MDHLRNVININDQHHQQPSQQQQFQGNLRLRQQQQQHYSEIQYLLAKRREKRLIEKTNKLFESKSLFAFFKYNNERIADLSGSSKVRSLAKVKVKVKQDPEAEDAVVIGKANAKSSNHEYSPSDDCDNAAAMINSSSNALLADSTSSFELSSRSNLFFPNELTNPAKQHQRHSYHASKPALSSKQKSANSSTTITTTTNNNNSNASRFFSESFNSILSSNSSVMQSLGIRLLYLQASMESRSDQTTSRDNQQPEDLSADFNSFYAQKMRDFGFEGHSNNVKLRNPADTGSPKRWMRKVPITSVLANKTNLSSARVLKPERPKCVDENEEPDEQEDESQLKKKKKSNNRLPKTEVRNDLPRVDVTRQRRSSDLAGSEDEDLSSSHEKLYKFKSPNRKNSSFNLANINTKSNSFAAHKFYSSSLITCKCFAYAKRTMKTSTRRVGFFLKTGYFSKKDDELSFLRPFKASLNR